MQRKVALLIAAMAALTPCRKECLLAQGIWNTLGCSTVKKGSKRGFGLAMACGGSSRLRGDAGRTERRNGDHDERPDRESHFAYRAPPTASELRALGYIGDLPDAGRDSDEKLQRDVATAAQEAPSLAMEIAAGDVEGIIVNGVQPSSAQDVPVPASSFSADTATFTETVGIMLRQLL